MSDKSIPSAAASRPRGKKPRQAPADGRRASGRHDPKSRPVQYDLAPRVIRGRDDMHYQLADNGPLGVELLEAQGFERVNPTEGGPALGMGFRRNQKGKYTYHGQVLMQIPKAELEEMREYGGFGVVGQSHFDQVDERVYDSNRNDPTRGHRAGRYARVEFESSSDHSAERAMAVTQDMVDV